MPRWDKGKPLCRESPAISTGGRQGSCSDIGRGNSDQRRRSRAEVGVVNSGSDKARLLHDNTTGRSKRFHVGNLEVTLKHVSPRKLALGERPAGEALTALWYLGKRQVTPQVIGQIKSRMAPEEYEVLKGASASMPAWMAESIRNYEKQHA